MKLNSNVSVINSLREKVLRLFVLRLKESDILKGNLRKVILFGSVARGESEPDSDLDVCVILNTGDKDRLTEHIIDISYEIDLFEGFCKTNISPFVRTKEQYENGLKAKVSVYEAIEKEGVVLYGSEE